MIWSLLNCRFAILNFSRCLINDMFGYLVSRYLCSLILQVSFFLMLLIYYLQYEAAWRTANWDFSLLYVGDNSMSSSLHIKSDHFNENLYR